MFKAALLSVWRFLEAWGEMKYEFHRKHNFKTWY
jgi:hypothetical protein